MYSIIVRSKSVKIGYINRRACSCVQSCSPTRIIELFGKSPVQNFLFCYKKEHIDGQSVKNQGCFEEALALERPEARGSLTSEAESRMLQM